MIRGLAVTFAAALITASSMHGAQAAPIYPVTSQISAHQTGGPSVTPLADGNNLWATQLTWTNTGMTDLTNVYFVNDQAWLNNPVTTPAQWNNATQTWVDGAYVASAHNAAFSMTLDPSVTNIGIPSGFGLVPGDSVPAFLIAASLAPGASVTTDVDFEITRNVTLFYFNGAVVGTQVPEPATLPLVAASLLGLGLLLRRRNLEA